MQFYNESLSCLDKFYPERTITISSSDPPYTTPEIKQMLRHKNRLLRQNKIEKASSLSLKINRAISKEISCDFKNVDPRKGLKPLWDKVKSLTNKDPERNYSTHITADDLNLHYSSISTDHNYSPPNFRLTAPPKYPFIEEYQLFYLLDHLHPTATRGGAGRGGPGVRTPPAVVQTTFIQIV